jgi:hypothetical protein
MNEKVNAPKNAMHSQKKCSVASSDGRRRRTEAPTTSVNKPTAASTKYSDIGRATGARDTSSACFVPSRTSV